MRVMWRNSKCHYDFVGNHGVNRPCHLANYMQCGNVLAISKRQNTYMIR